MRDITLHETTLRPTLDELPYPEELESCSPSMRELALDVSKEIGEYLEERI